MRCTICLLVAFVALTGGTAARTDEIDDLRDVVAAQGKLIEELRDEIDEKKEAPAAKQQPGGTTTASEKQAAEVTPEYVDERIQDYETAPQSRFLVSGYGTAQYVAVNGKADGFGVRFNPGFHFRMSDRLHFNGELERDGDDTVTEVGFEQIAHARV